MGLGAAYIAGFEFAIKMGYDYIFEMDADFSHNPSDLLKLKAACEKDGNDMAVGSRYVEGVNVVNKNVLDLSEKTWEIGAEVNQIRATQLNQIFNESPISVRIRMMIASWLMRSASA